MSWYQSRVAILTTSVLLVMVVVSLMDACSRGMAQKCEGGEYLVLSRQGEWICVRGRTAD